MRSFALLIVLVTSLTACAPAAPGPSSSSPSAGGAQAQPPTENRPTQTLITAVRVEPLSLANKPVTATGAGVGFVTRVFNAELDMIDGSDRARPYLAEELPQLNTDTWKVSADGKMETTYQLKPNLTWQDGTPLAAEDFVFALRVYKTPALGVSTSSPIKQMEEILAPDPRTVVIRWNTLYPDAGVLKNEFQPLPRHILEQPYQQDAGEAFANHPYWTTQYIGLGPYKLERWEPGASVEGSAFAGHVLGRPKIDRIIVLFMPDENIVLTNLLAENVHMALDRSVRFEHTQVMQQEWASNHKGVVLLTPSLVRYVLYQFRPEVVNPRGILDLRVRRALFHALDRQGLNEGVFAGQTVVTDTFVSPDVPYFSELDRALTKYPYDPRRSEQLMNEAGFTKDSGGYFAANGERFAPLFWEESGSQNEKELGIIVDTWRRAGFDISTFVLQATQLRDAQLRATYPAMYTTQGGGSTEDRLDTFTTATIPSQANRYQGNNRGGWVNTDYDRLWQQFGATLDRTERNRQVIQMLKLVSDDVPAMPIYFNMAPVAHLATLTGPEMTARVPDPRIYWNLHEWAWK